MAIDENKTQLIKFLFDEAEIFFYKELHRRDMYFAISEQCIHSTSTDTEDVDVRSVPDCTGHFTGGDRYSILCVYVKEHQALPI